MMMNNRNIFLWDGVGALLSAISLGLILPWLHTWIGLPVHVLQRLAGLALLYCIYDFCCLRWSNHQNPMWLWGIILANLSHCILSLACLVIYADQVTLWGIMYFVFETLIVLWIVYYEIRIVKSLE